MQNDILLILYPFYIYEKGRVLNHSCSFYSETVDFGKKR